MPEVSWPTYAPAVAVLDGWDTERLDDVDDDEPALPPVADPVVAQDYHGYFM